MVIRVLFADQSATTQRLAASAFAQEKIEVIKVGNGDLAMWLLDEINPHVVIADASLPDTNGYELCHFIKHTPRLSHIPVLLLYWSDETFDYAKADDALADAYLAKPFESHTLIEIVRRLIQEQGEERKLLTSPPALIDPEDDWPGTVEPLDASEIYEQATPDSSSEATESQPPFLIAYEESSPASDGPLEDEPTHEPAADEEASLEETSLEEAPVEESSLAMAAPPNVEDAEDLSYYAPDEQAPATDSPDPGVIEQRPIRSPLTWAVLIIIALSAILGIWQATRIPKTRPVVTPNENRSQGEQHSQASSTSSSDTLPELPPMSESPARKASSPVAAPEQDQSLNPGIGARSTYPRPSPLARKGDLSENPYDVIRAINNRAANNNKPADPKGRLLAQIKPPEPPQAPVPTPKNDKPEPSPVRIIPVDVPSPAAPGKVKAGSGSKQAARSVNGFEQIGSGVKGAVVWSGKKAGRGIKAIARELKRAFKNNARVE
jgi:DNA-binding response OmpR family regulator